MLRGQPAGPSISVARAESRKRDKRRTSDQNKEARERVKALSLSRRRKTRPKHGTRCVYLLCECRRLTLTSSRAGQIHILRVDVRRTGRSGTVRLVRTSHSVRVVLWFHRMERRANDKHLSSPFGLGAQIDSAGEDPLRLVAVRRAASCVVVTLTLSLNESTELHRTTSKLELN